MKRGLVLGKFMPPHEGHLLLCRFGRAWVDELWVVVCSLATEPIPGEQRFAWMRESLPEARVVHLTEPLPQTPDEHPEFYRVWREALLRVAPQPDVVFASEAYGPALADALSASFVPVDPSRDARPVSGTAAREDPYAVWEHLPPPVRASLAKRVSIFGPESTGKTTLARALAARFATRWVPEYARTWLTAKPGGPSCEPGDMVPIARGQRILEDTLARDANRVLVCDTDPLATTVWSEALFGAVHPEVARIGAAGRYDLTLLCAPDVPWVPDDVRYLPGESEAFHARCERVLRDAGRRWVSLEGDWPAREARAAQAVESLFPR